MDIDEKLSQLWSGELPEAQARLLRQRIEAEPELGRRWRRLQAAMQALEDLPDALPPPALRSREAPARRSWPWAASALAAAILLALSLRSPQPELVLVEGAQWVEGEVLLRAGAVDVEVDGRAWISVEPPGGQPRVGVPEPEEEMDKSTVIAALTGAVVTVVVYQGSAVIRESGASGAEPTVIEAGERHQVGGPAPRTASAPPTPLQRQQHVEQLQLELEQAKQELAEAQFEGALTRGQLQAMQGKPSPWPSELPEAFSPEHFRENLQARLQQVPGAEIAEVDCSEYPCVGAIRYTGPASEDWGQPISETVRTWLHEVGGEEMSISVNNSRFQHDDQEERYVIFGAHSGDRDTDVGTRTEYRIDAMVDELGAKLKEGQ